MGKVNLFLAFIGVFAPVAYLVGLSFFQETLDAYGVSPKAFLMTAQEAIT